MATFIPVPDLDEKVAVMIAPEVRKIAERVQLHAKTNAPAMKRWVSMADGVVRPTHVHAHGQEVPENLRFEVPSMEWDMLHRGVGPITYMMQPKDESSRAVANIKNCRCVKALSPAAIADKVMVGPTQVYGTHVRVVVYCEAYKVVQAEFGDTYDGGLYSAGTRFMGKAAAAAARESKAR